MGKDAARLAASCEPSILFLKLLYNSSVQINRSILNLDSDINHSLLHQVGKTQIIKEKGNYGKEF